jgi:ribosomal protein S18 acetylase RimI-like enzyme
MSLPDPSEVEVLPFHPSFQKAAASLVRGILRDELRVADDLGDEEDLRDIGRSYALPDNCFMVALAKGKVVATGGIRRLSETDCELRHLYVKAPYRRQGLASSIVAKLVSFVGERGYTRILLAIRPEMEEFSKIYGRYGFRETADDLPRPGKFMSIDL